MTDSKPDFEQIPDSDRARGMQDAAPDRADPTPPGGMPPVTPDTEPPIDPLADTNPTQNMPPVSLDDDDLPMWRHVTGIGMLLLALALVIVAGVIFVMPLLNGDGEATPPPATDIAAQPTDASAEPAPTREGQAGLLSIPATLSPDQIAALLAANPPRSLDAGEELSVAEAAIPREDSPFTIVPERPRAEVISYTIEEGDTVEAIATRFGLEKDTIAWSNDRNVVFALRPGNELYIMPVDGVYYRALVDETIQSIADKYDVDPYDIINSEFNTLFGATPADTIRSGEYVVVPGGTSSYNDWTYNPVVERTGGGGGGSSDAGYISFAPGQPGSCGSQANPGGTGYFGQPLSRYSWVRGFTGYHTGVDLAAPSGTPVYASSPGRVIYRGWNDWGYGYLVVLAHGPFTSFYAHLSSINVGCGQMVGAGALIGGVGTTGNSSGDHLHFEIRYNDIPVDPLLYVGF
ncbi:MAG: M23 family metallopeptidase [Anaerolineae bacterium]|nr:M23 family metallopeptidase [Anaerolineae bacterium]